MTYMRCIRCVMPTTRPDVPFFDGLCGACHNHDQAREIDWRGRKEELRALIESMRHNGSGYDMIVPSSGGKDSTKIALYLIEMGYKPLVVTATTCHLTPQGAANIRNLARYADTLEFTPNITVRNKLIKAGLDLVGDGTWSEHAAIFTIPFKVAIRYGIPLLFFGENSQQAYGGPPGTETAKKLTMRWRSEFSGMNGLRPADLVGYDGIAEADMAIYEAPPVEELDRGNIQAHFLGAYMEWDSVENAKFANAHGMRQIMPCPQNWWPSENQDDFCTGPLHDFLMVLKLGYGRGCMQSSIDIRCGRAKRESALEFVKEYDTRFPETYMGKPTEQILKEVGISKSEYIRALNRFLNKSLFVEDHIEWGQRLTLKEFV